MWVHIFTPYFTHIASTLKKSADDLICLFKM